jgi:Nucleoside 2-deoxyribosyltransferase like
MRLIRAPEQVDAQPGELRVFLAGSIDMGSATDWQAALAQQLAHVPGVLVNPRRLDWGNAPAADTDSGQLRDQIGWELEALEQADLVAFHFAPGTLAPITLLELGLVCCRQPAVVCCPPDYWRHVNVRMLCERYGVPQVADLAGLAHSIAAWVQRPAPG